jgi:DNA-binding transcriptional LysR family regulator
VELRHLRYFVVLAEELHFGRAAKRLSITQPPLSFNIQKLEEHLGVRLFARDSRSVSMTQAGEAFLAEARRVLSQAGHAEETARAVANGQMGSLQIAFTSSMLYRGMPEMLAAFGERYPVVEFDLMDMPITEQVESLEQGRIHVGFAPALTVPRGLSGLRLADDVYAVVVPDRHWAADRQRIRLNVLANETFVLFTRDTTPSGYEQVVSMCVHAGFHPRVRYYVRQWLAALALVSKGFGIALVPASLQAAAPANLRFLALDDPRRQLSAYLLWHPQKVSAALDKLIGEVRQGMAPRRRPAT